MGVNERLKSLTDHWLPRAVKTESSLSRDFAVLSAMIVLAVFLISVWMVWEVSSQYRAETRTNVNHEISRIDEVMNTNIEYAKYVMESLARQIFLFGLNDHQQIAKILRTFDTRPDLFGLFAWINAEQKLIISSNKGVISGNVTDVSDREYQRSSLEYPWKVHIGAPIAGRTSGKWVLPVAMGLTDDTGKYVGTIIISIDIEGLISQIDRGLSMPGLTYTILGPDMAIMGEGGNLTGPQSSLIPASGFDKSTSLAEGDSLLHEANFIENKRLSAYYAHSEHYPYTIMLGFERAQTWRQMAGMLLPRLLQPIITGLFLLSILWLIRHRVIQPMEGLATAASQIARGRTDTAIPMAGPVELAALAHQIQRIKEFVEERRRIEDELRRKNNTLHDAKEASELADRSKSEFLATMSHELRTPLNAIIGFSDVMMNGYYGAIENEKYAQYVEDIYNSGQHLLEIINDILDLAKVESGAMTLQENDIDLKRVIQKSLRLLSERANMASITLEVDIPNIPVIHGDPLRIKQIIINLLSNAIKFTPEGGLIRVTGTYDPRAPYPIAIRVTDNGIGMSPEQIPVALSKFGQLENDQLNKPRDANENKGTGLGLPLSLELMKLHQGDLKIESELGQGTTVTIIFPAARIASDRLSA